MNKLQRISALCRVKSICYNTVRYKRERRVGRNAPILDQMPKLKAVQPSGKHSNIGANHRLNLFAEHGEIDPDILEEDFEDAESDVMQGHKRYDEHRKELRQLHEKKNYYNIRRKHFKEPKQPNMLTYAEKVQIRTLHNSEPTQWTPEQLSQNFPVTIKIIKKIIKSDWKAKDVESVRRHDQQVIKNWELLNNGQLENISDDFKQHLLKFTSRKITELPDDEIKKLLPHLEKRPRQTAVYEFSKIIDEYEERKLPLLIEEKKETINFDENNTAEMGLIDETVRTQQLERHYTLDNLREATAKKKQHKLTDIDKLILNSDTNRKLVKSGEENDKDLPKLSFLGVDTYSENTTVVSPDYKMSLKLDEGDYPLRIDIPRNAKKRSALYRLKDCFYDEGGFFLYRVPGLVVSEKQNEENKND